MSESIQENNTVYGDQANRDINKNSVILITSPSTAITELNYKYISESSEDRGLQEYIDELNHLTMRLPYAKKDLATKLTEGDRLDEVDGALFSKERITKKILMLSQSATAQQILAFALGKVKQSFRLKVYPIIKSGNNLSAVNRAIYDDVLNPAFIFLEVNPLNLSEEDIYAMIYFLSGNCHIDWS